jgi:hypothetical protein
MEVMMRSLDIALGDTPPGSGAHGGSGGGTEDDPNFPRQALRSQGLLAIAFGFALGITFMIFFGIFNRLPELAPFVEKAFWENFANLWFSFLYGFVCGTILAVIYNLLVLRRLNLFGLESSAD